MTLTKQQRFVFSPGVDFVAFGLPILVATAFAPSFWLMAPDEVPRWAWMFLVVAVDVAHVWATIFRTYLDQRELFRLPHLYLSVPIICFVVAFAICWLGSPRHFWTFISYAAIYHFIKQDLGLLFLYLSRNSDRVTKQQIDLERMTLYVGAACPILLWHAGPPDTFHWFRAGERFVFQLPAALVLPVKAVWLATLLTYVSLEVRRYRLGVTPNVGKLYVMGASWLTWMIGTLCDHEVATLAVLNLFHGIPFFVMIFQYCRRRWASLEPAGCGDRLTVLLTRRWYVFLSALFALALLEELLWDALVFQDYAPQLCQRWLGEASTEAGGSGMCSRLWSTVAPSPSATSSRVRIQSAGAISVVPGAVLPGRMDKDQDDGEDDDSGLFDLSDTGIALATAALATPQLVHYVLDAYIWRMNPKLNPRLKEYLLGAPPPKVADQVSPAAPIICEPMSQQKCPTHG
eukprot:CAMPEP_0115866474 /NCGR_PEP_ID=MMETSP0287-20121206/20267_1 /TAXON_ID=412157 /ORGANISM="Chrysochromulina rotalis, Strain UIO044" /LENGTH=458 /DNA_ID=CAMNT_0003321041 /DNA_START=35 /DNA_END=1411 /DNA_ORIENTATION=-